jgi:glycosyltransferase involved in cell wall biosynthesis
MEKVSVVIPCFNAGQYLDEAVRSALAQTYENLEVVVVDDGSTDAETARVLAAAAWPRTRIFRQANAGPSAARNHAIREATGHYILPLDADDTIEPTYVEKAMAALSTRPEIGCVYCKAMKFGAEQGPWDLPPYNLYELVIDNVIFVTALFRKHDWQAVGGFDEQLRHGVEDYDFWVKMIASGKQVVQLDEYLFNYRVREKSRTTRFQDGLEGKVATYAEIFRNNKDFYAANAELLFRHRFGLYAQVGDWQRRFEELQAATDAEHAQWCKRCEELEAAMQDFRIYWQGRYGALDAFANRHPLLRKLAGFVKRLF